MNNTIYTRESNMELLRLIAMFLVLMVHTGAISLSAPTFDLLKVAPIDAILQLLTQAFSIVCVNIFVFITGWYGIKLRYKGVMNILFQCLFYSFLIYFIFLFTSLNIDPFKGFLGALYLNSRGWFIKSYLLLLFISPVLNSFILNSSKKQLEIVLILFYSFQTIFGWASKGVSFFNSGYSTISFIGLYLLARYIYIYKPFWSLFKKGSYLLIYLFTILANIGIFLTCFIVSNKINKIEQYQDFIYWNIFSYFSPLVIIGALSLLLYFSQLNLGINSRINKIAQSTFAIYLIHCNQFIFPFYTNYIFNLYSKYSGNLFYFYGNVFLFILIVFIASIIIDQIRIFIWNRIKKRLLSNKLFTNYDCE